MPDALAGLASISVDKKSDDQEPGEYSSAEEWAAYWSGRLGTAEAKGRRSPDALAGLAAASKKAPDALAGLQGITDHRKQDSNDEEPGPDATAEEWKAFAEKQWKGKSSPPRARAATMKAAFAGLQGHKAVESEVSVGNKSADPLAGLTSPDKDEPDNADDFKKYAIGVLTSRRRKAHFEAKRQADMARNTVSVATMPKSSPPGVLDGLKSLP